MSENLQTSAQFKGKRLTVVPEIPRRVAVAIQRAMAKKPEERFMTATEMTVEISKASAEKTERKA